jgi:hypothetical protein
MGFGLSPEKVTMQERYPEGTLSNRGFPAQFLSDNGLFPDHIL